MKRTPSLAFLLQASRTSMLALAAMLVVSSTFAAEQAPAAAKTGDAAAPKGEEQVKAGDKKADNDKADDKKEDKAKVDEKKAETESRNWFDVSVSGAIVGGDKAAYQRRYGLPSGAFGGVEDFHYEEDIKKKGIFKVDGRGIF